MSAQFAFPVFVCKYAVVFCSVGGLWFLLLVFSEHVATGMGRLLALQWCLIDLIVAEETSTLTLKLAVETGCCSNHYPFSGLGVQAPQLSVC